jgi:hypothetical protein
MKFTLPLFVLFSIFFTSNTYAQQNIIKWRPAALGWNNIDLSYERVINEKSSFAVKVGFMVPLDIVAPYSNYLDQQATQNGASSTGFTMTKGFVNGFSILPEYRFYTAKEAPKGFYVAPYLKLWRGAMGANVQDSALNPYDIVASLNILGAGVGIGYQWVIADVITIDWNFLGLGADAYILNATVTGPNYADVSQQIQDSGNASNVIISGAGNITSITSTPTILPGLKTNFSIGYMF